MVGPSNQIHTFFFFFLARNVFFFKQIVDSLTLVQVRFLIPNEFWWQTVENWIPELFLSFRIVCKGHNNNPQHLPNVYLMLDILIVHYVN